MHPVASLFLKKECIINPLVIPVVLYNINGRDHKTEAMASTSAALCKLQGTCVNFWILLSTYRRLYSVVQSTTLLKQVKI
jgi:hypothetical protein